MADVSQYYDSIAVGITVNDYVNNLAESAKAAGYAAFIDAITGSVPQVLHIPNTNRVRLILTKAQIPKVQEWLDTQVTGAFKPSGPPAPVEYELGPALGPWALKYAIPSVLGIAFVAFVSGYLLKSIMR